MALDMHPENFSAADSDETSFSMTDALRAHASAFHDLHAAAVCLFAALDSEGAVVDEVRPIVHGLRAALEGIGDRVKDMAKYAAILPDILPAVEPVDEGEQRAPTLRDLIDYRVQDLWGAHAAADCILDEIDFVDDVDGHAYAYAVGLQSILGDVAKQIEKLQELVVALPNVVIEFPLKDGAGYLVH